MPAARRQVVTARRLYLPALLVATLAGAVLRWHGLADANPWWDEGFTYWLSSMSVPGMLLRTAGDTHPPLSYLLFHWWMVPAGRSIYALRYLSALCGIATIPMCAALARRLAGPFAGVVAAYVLAVSRFHIWWSDQIRMYALVGLLCALSMYLLLRALAAWKCSRSTAWCALLALGVVNLLGLFTLYFFALLIVLECVLVLVRRDWRILGAWSALQLGSLALFAPWLAYFRQHAIRFATPADAPLTFPQFLAATWSELTLGIDTNVEHYRPLLLALGVMALLLLVVVGQASLPAKAPQERDARWQAGTPALPRRAALWLVLVAAGLPLAAYGITLQRGLFFNATYQTRYDLPALPALVVLLACGIASLPRLARLLPLALFAGVAVYTLPGLYHDRHRTDDYQTLARFVQAYERPGDAIVFDPDKNFHLFLLDYRGALPLESIPLNQPVDAAYADRLLSPWAARYHGLWLLQEAGGHDAGAAHPVRGWLGSHLHPTLQLASGDKLLVLYEPAGAPPRTVSPAFKAEHSNAGVSFDQAIEDVRPGDVLNLPVYGPAPRNIGFAGQTYTGRQFPGQTIFAIPIGAAAPAGRQPISAVLGDRRSQPFGSVYVEPHAAAPSQASAPPLASVVGRGFGGQAELTSYDVAQTGTKVTVRLQWRALRTFSQNYTVFVHLLDSAGHVATQRDSQPLDGRLPTIRWQAGQIIDDSYTMDAPKPGSYQIEIGLYLQATGERLSLSDEPSQDRLLLGPAKVR